MIHQFDADRAGRRHHDRHGADQYARHIPGFSLNRHDDTQVICGEVGGPNLQVQLDCYHCHIIEGDLAVKLKRDMPRIGHIQIAGVPEGHESDIGELNYPYLFDLIDEPSATKAGSAANTGRARERRRGSAGRSRTCAAMSD